MGSVAVVYSVQGRYSEALEFHEESLAIIREKVPDAIQEADALNAIGATYGYQGEYQKALEYVDQALEIANDIKHQPSIITTLTNIAQIYAFQGDYPNALENFQAALNPVQTLELRPLESSLLSSVGHIYYLQGKYDQAIEFRQQALLISQELGQQINQASALSGLSVIAIDQGNYDKALNDAQQSLNIYETIGALPNQSDLRALIGRINYIQGDYAQAIDTQQQAVDISQSIDDKDNEAYALQQLGLTYSQLGQYDRALNLNQQALTIAQEIGDRAREASSLDAIANIYAQQQQYDQGLDYHDQALTIWRDIESPVGEARSLRDIGFVQEQRGNYDAAEDAFQTALDLQQEIGAIGYRGLTENGLALAYAGQGDTNEALSLLQQAIAIHRDLGDRPNEARVFSDLGQILAEQDQPELAITFLKQSVNLTETLRAQLNGLPKEEQQAYAEVMSDRYRLLADLLLQEDRILEAQEVVDLLKLQELDDFNLRTRGNSETAQGLDFWPAEREILALFNQHLETNRDDSFTDFVNSDAIQQQVEQLRRNAQGQNLNPEQLEDLQDNLQQLGNAALLYPLISDDRLELILVTPSSLVNETIDIDRITLNETIRDFRSDITDRLSDPLPNAQQLYQWLIEPIADDLAQAGAETILYAADGQLRYIPLAALHDGEQYLTQQFPINHITAASLTDFTRDEDENALQILAGAFSDTNETHSFEIGDRQFSLQGLEFAGVEVETIANEIPNTLAFFNQDFSRLKIEPEMEKHTVIHFATHAEFVPGFPHES
ncbi:MAG: tetratricopeptide repeat protein, partial [Elainellaceae cyanobacterium]